VPPELLRVEQFLAADTVLADPTISGQTDEKRGDPDHQAKSPGEPVSTVFSHYELWPADALPPDGARDQPI
jgi:hypothetical protein